MEEFGIHCIGHTIILVKHIQRKLILNILLKKSEVSGNGTGGRQNVQLCRMRGELHQRTN